MTELALYFLTWLFVMSVFIALLPKERAYRVTTFVRTVLRVLPVPAMIRALRASKNETDNDSKSDIGS